MTPTDASERAARLAIIAELDDAYLKLDIASQRGAMVAAADMLRADAEKIRALEAKLETENAVSFQTWKRLGMALRRITKYYRRGLKRLLKSSLATQPRAERSNR